MWLCNYYLTEGNLGLNMFVYIFSSATTWTSLMA